MGRGQCAPWRQKPPRRRRREKGARARVMPGKTSGSRDQGSHNDARSSCSRDPGVSCRGEAPLEHPKPAPPPAPCSCAGVCVSGRRPQPLERTARSRPLFSLSLCVSRRGWKGRTRARRQRVREEIVFFVFGSVCARVRANDRRSEMRARAMFARWRLLQRKGPRREGRPHTARAQGDRGLMSCLMYLCALCCFCRSTTETLEALSASRALVLVRCGGVQGLLRKRSVLGWKGPRESSQTEDSGDESQFFTTLVTAPGSVC